MKKFTPSELRAILRGLDQNQSQRAISRKLGISKDSAGRIAEIIAKNGEVAANLLDYPDEALLAYFYSTSVSPFVEPDWADIHRKSSRRGVTLLKVYEEYKRHTPGKPYSYPTFCKHYNTWRKENGMGRTGGNIDRVPGERMEIDFAGDKLTWVDSSTGQIRLAKLFVASLPYSSLFFTEAFDDETQNSWVTGIVDALEYFGAVPQVLVMDNAKALVIRANWSDPQVQAGIQALCDHYGMEPWPCRPGKPKQKNRVEAAVGDVERWIIADFQLAGPIVAHDLPELNSVIRKRVDELNAQAFRGRGSSGSRRTRYETEERQHMSPLPAYPYEHGVWKLPIVDKGHCIKLADGHRYSTPASYIGKKVAVRITGTFVEIVDPVTMAVIGKHPRYWNRGGVKTHILQEHLTPAEKSYRKTPGDWVEAFEKSAMPRPLAERLVAYLREKKGGFPSGRVCGAILRLFKDFAPSIVCRAISQALEDQIVNYKHIRKICEQFEYSSRTNISFDFNEKLEIKKIIHCNIRNDYE